MPQFILVTGATRGLGKALVEKYLAQPDTVVVAAVRDTTAASAKALDTLAKGSGSKLVVVKIDSLSPSDPATAMSALEADGISHLDVVIANAAISDDYSPVTQVPPKNFAHHMETNTYGTLYLIQATYPLLAKSKNAKFVAVGSALGAIHGMEQRGPIPTAAYGPSKAAVHWLTRKLHFENENLISFCLDPGWVQTDMGCAGARKFGIDMPPTTVEDCVNGMVSVIDHATRDKNGGRNCTWDGSEFPW